jgi:hypothetical protein
MDLPSLLPLGVHKSNLGTVEDEVLLDTGEIVEVTREHKNTDMCGPGRECCAVTSCNCSGNISTLSGSE